MVCQALARCNNLLLLSDLALCINIETAIRFLFGCGIFGKGVVDLVSQEGCLVGCGGDQRSRERLVMQSQLRDTVVGMTSGSHLSISSSVQPSTPRVAFTSKEPSSCQGGPLIIDLAPHNGTSHQETLATQAASPPPRMHTHPPP